MSIEVRPVTPDLWSDLVSVFGRRGDDPSRCWCRLFLRDPDAPGLDGEPSGRLRDNRAALEREVAGASTPPGLIAYTDGVPVGWTRIGPRAGFPRVGTNRALTRVLEDEPGAWWITCFAIDSRRRRSGVGSALLAGAVTFARARGANAVEGHPVDVDALSATRVSGSALFTGTMAMFTAAGFTEIGRTYPSRPVMRLEL